MDLRNRKKSEFSIPDQVNIICVTSVKIDWWDLAPCCPPIERSQIHSQWADSPQSALSYRSCFWNLKSCPRNFKLSEYKVPFSHQPGVTITPNQPILESVLFPLVTDAASGWDRKVPESSKASSWLALCEKEVCQRNSCCVLILY